VGFLFPAPHRLNQKEQIESKRMAEFGKTRSAAGDRTFNFTVFGNSMTVYEQDN
jgi:hypothetical protein